MLFYVNLILIVIILTKLFTVKASEGTGYYIAALLLTFIACFRFDVGWDYVNYYNIIDEKRLAALIRFEPLSLMVSLPAILTDSPYLFFILSGGIIYPLTFYALKKNSVSPAVSLIVYMGLFYLISFSIVRQSMALGICFYAFKYIKNRRFYKYLVAIIIATLFHYSAIVSLIIYPIYHWIKLKYLIILLFVGLLFRNLFFGILANYGLYDDYLLKLNDIEGGSLTKYFNLLLFFSFFILIKIKSYKIEEKKILSIIVVGLFAPYYLGNAMGERIGYYFLIYYCYAIPLLLQGKMLYKRNLYTLIFSTYFLAMIYFTSNISGQKSAYTPYRTIFNVSRVEFK